jgi:hypothetical protein
MATTRLELFVDIHPGSLVVYHAELETTNLRVVSGGGAIS